MASEVIIFFPKYTTLCGQATYVSDPFDVSEYKTVVAETLLIAAVGTGAVANATLEGSGDMNTWTTISGGSNLTAGTVWPQTATSPPRYIRMKITTSAGTDMSVTLWSRAVARDC